MVSVLKGVRVLEVAQFALAPSAAAILSDWGAEVVKVEHAEHGDFMRGLSGWGVPADVEGINFLWDTYNRGKRSVGVDLSLKDGRGVVLELARHADVFITNYLPSARAKLGIDVDDIRAANPDIVYGRGSAHGPRGGEADVGGFESIYWLRTGAASAATGAGGELVTIPAPGFGDGQTGLAFAGGLAAALFHRERTGEALTVDVSLLSSGIWAMQAGLVGANLTGRDELVPTDRHEQANPVGVHYETSDHRFIKLVMLHSDRYWPGFCEAIGRKDLLDDPRFADAGARAANRRACIEELSAEFARRPLSEWVEILGRQRGQWTVVQTVSELNDDRQALANGYLQDVDWGGGRTVTLAPAPVQFDEQSASLQRAPEFGEHTEEVLLELGYDWDGIGRLKKIGAVN
ncbi:MAG: CoA transferase [Gammaproteobacteria bacterium]|nr:CoA transferase [Gammaproteobacteria bacterium]MDE0365256.1 CoA transferase [Gammaproteobacteria bacterium]